MLDNTIVIIDHLVHDNYIVYGVPITNIVYILYKYKLVDTVL